MGCACSYIHLNCKIKTCCYCAKGLQTKERPGPSWDLPPRNIHRPSTCRAAGPAQAVVWYWRPWWGKWLFGNARFPFRSERYNEIIWRWLVICRNSMQWVPCLFHSSGPQCNECIKKHITPKFLQVLFCYVLYKVGMDILEWPSTLFNNSWWREKLGLKDPGIWVPRSFAGLKNIP